MTTTVVQSVGDPAELNQSQKVLVTKLDTALQALDEKQAEVASYLEELKEREDEVKRLKDALYEKMEEAGIKKLENDHLAITAVWPTVRHTIDAKKLETMDPVLFAQVNKKYGKDTPVKGSVRISVKKK